MNEKYIAGLIDADGHLSVRTRIDATPDLEISIAQRTKYLDVLKQIQDEFGGTIRRKQNADYDNSELQMRCGPARKCMERLKKYMVLKRHHAEMFIDLVDNASVLKTQEDVQRIRRRVKEIRRYGANRLPNFPAKKWLAGYVDGDASFNVKVCSKTGYAYPSISIMAAPNYEAGIVIIQQAFNGKICSVKNNALYQLQLPPSKAKQFFEYFAKYLIIKKPQAYYLFECAKNGNYRDGDTIREHIKLLNDAQQHRLSDSVEEAILLARKVNFSIDAKWVRRMR